MAQPPRLVAGPALQFRIAEGLLGPELGSEDIRLLHRVTSLAGQGQKGLQIQGFSMVAEPTRQFGVPLGVGQEGIELVQAHHGSATLSSLSEPEGRGEAGGYPLSSRAH